MVYKMERKQSSFEKGDSGIGVIRFSKDGKKVQAILNVSVGKDKFEERKYLFDIDDCPTDIQKAKSLKQALIQLSSDNTKILDFRPASGLFIVRTKEFPAKEGEEPAPKTKEVDMVKDGKRIQFSYEYFTVLLEIVSPEDVKGLTIPLVLRYHFAEKVIGGKSITIFSGGGKYTDQLEEYMLAAGILDEKYMPLEYKDNILPDMQRIALREDRQFQVYLQDGWVKPGSIVPLDVPDSSVPFDEPFDIDEEEINERLESVMNGTSEFDEEEIPFDVE